MRHRIAGLAAVVLGGTVLGGAALLPLPAGAHGAPQNPMSRAAACGSENARTARSAACKAAVRASGAGLRQQWDNLRVAYVNGRDRAMIPNGKLCSAGIPAFKGLDLARADWPSTRLASGARYTFKYRGTIPHKGTFRMYVTKNGYSATRPLKWSDLERKPFLTVTDPKMANGSYVMKGTLPSGKSGRHLIYTIWQNSDTPDTYYSCSDVIFGTGGGGAVAAGTEHA
uniref:lytic polysaccharide monooxygenase auxiliary activity family 9 protein n=1 Tax=Nonomuraea rhizosphaerae TaxID=2665663 RepID=UPI001C5EB8C0